MVSEEKKYRVIGYNQISHEWLVGGLQNKEEVLNTYTTMQNLAHYTNVTIVQELAVSAKLVYTLE